MIDEGSGFTAVWDRRQCEHSLPVPAQCGVSRAGDAPVARVRWLWANGLNLVLDPASSWPRAISGAGVTGAAVATTIGRGRAAPTCSGTCCRPGLGVPAQPGAFAALDRTPGPGFHRRHRSALIATSSWILVIRIIAMWGSAPVAAYTIAIPHDRVRFSPRLGARQRGGHHGGPEPGAARSRSRRSGGAARCNVLFMTTLGGVFFVFCAANRRPVFRRHGNLALHGTHCLRILGLGYPMYAVGMIITQALNGPATPARPRS